MAPDGSERSARQSLQGQRALERVRLAVRLDSPAVFATLGDSEALGAWQYASPVRPSGSWQRLAVHVPRQAILVLQP